MSALLRWLTSVPAIIASFVLMVLIGLSFAPVQALIDGPLLDMIATGEAARVRLEEMSAVQKTAHFWASVLNDTAYPIAYGAFFAGLAGRFAPARFRGWAMLPALAAAVVDLFENTVQALALSGSADLLDLKNVLTPLKFGFLVLAALLALSLSLLALIRWIMRRAAKDR